MRLTVRWVLRSGATVGQWALALAALGGMLALAGVSAFLGFYIAAALVGAVAGLYGWLLATEA